MAPRNNPYARDPALAQAFNNLASMFAPPSGADAAGFATAGAKRAEAERLKWLFENSSDPTASARSALIGVQGYGNTPAGFMQSDATTRRGQDVTARTSAENNIRDNARSMAQTRYGDLKEGEVRVAMPGSVAALYGLPEGPAQTGVVKLGQNQTATLPDGSTMTGINRALSMDEWTAQQAERQRQAGTLPDDQITDLVFGKQSPVTVMGADGKPVYATPGSAARKQLPAAAAPTAGADTEVTKLIRERDALPAGDPNRAAYDSRIAALGRGQQQSAYDKNNDESFAKLNEEIFSNGAKATADRGTYAALEAAVNNPNVTQGVLGAASLGLKKTLNAFGLDAGSTGPAEMLQSLGNQISLRLRDPSNGGGMPGALSDSDREFLRSMTLSLGNSPDANRLLAQYYLAAQQKAIDLDGLRQQYVSKNGRIDEGFRTHMSEYLRGNDPTLPLRSKLAGGQPVRVNSPADADKLPPGTPIIWNENGRDVSGVVPGAQ